MSISREDTNPSHTFDTDAEAFLDQLEQQKCPTNGSTESRRPTNLREAACGRWVIVPPQFDVSAKLSPNEIVRVSYSGDDMPGVWFHVHESIVADPTRYDAFVTQVLEEFPELPQLGAVSFCDVDLNDDIESFTDIGVYQIDEMERIREKMKPRKFLVENYIPAESLILSAGDSNIGKTPAQYQLGICIAAGVPFFGIPVSRGRVLYFDFENTYDDTIAKSKDISRHLQLKSVPKYFKIWHPSMAVEGYDEHHIWEIVRKVCPTLVIIDTLTASFPQVEKGNTDAGIFINDARKITREVGCAIMVTHHLTKSAGRNDGPGAARFVAPAETTIQEAMKDVRGASAIVNGVDVRWMFRKPRKTDGPCAFELQGFRRMYGAVPTIAVERVMDQTSGEPIGYNRLAGVNLIKNPRYREIFGKLPADFFYKHLHEHGLGGGSCTHCINDYRSAGVLDPDETNPFRKRKEYR